MNLEGDLLGLPSEEWFAPDISIAVDSLPPSLYWDCSWKLYLMMATTRMIRCLACKFSGLSSYTMTSPPPHT